MSVKCLLAENHRRLILEALPPAGRLLEWGVGGSTLYFLDRLSGEQKLTSIEHDSAWSQQVQAAATVREGIWRCWTVDCAREWLGQNATGFEECPSDLRQYIVPPGEDLSKFDVFLVDGVARGACLAHVLLNAKSGAVAFLHDYHRRWYDWVIDAGAKRIKAATAYPGGADYPVPMLRLDLR